MAKLKCDAPFCVFNDDSLTIFKKFTKRRKYTVKKQLELIKESSSNSHA